jgi:hypothetical protein
LCCNQSPEFIIIHPSTSTVRRAAANNLSYTLNAALFWRQWCKQKDAGSNGCCYKRRIIIWDHVKKLRELELFDFLSRSFWFRSLMYELFELRNLLIDFNFPSPFLPLGAASLLWKVRERIDLCWLLLLSEWWNGNWYRPCKANVATVLPCDLWQFSEDGQTTPQHFRLDAIRPQWLR